MLEVLDLSPEERDLRDEVREWIRGHRRDELAGWTATGIRTQGGPVQHAAFAEFTDEAGRAGLVCAGWPRQYGGRGLTGREIALIDDEFSAASMPRPNRGMSESYVGPALINHGTDEQKERLLPGIISGADFYCQGFSEPGAGSDLAGLRTSGVVDGDQIVINGQKIWTSSAHRANKIFLLCRTDPTVPKHQGISYVLMDLALPDGSPNGVDIRPIRQMTGEAHFCEVFFDDARAELRNVIGGLNNGWHTAMTTLGNERGGEMVTKYLEQRQYFHSLLADLGHVERPASRDRLARLYAELEIMRFSGLRVLSEGTQVTATKIASIAKVSSGEFAIRMSEAAVDILAQAPASGSVTSGVREAYWRKMFLAARSETIWGGTAQIQRNIIAERVLGLPKSR
jgi:alkylation response protein AidB-like acyl-CoA dehydrogenase